jgi:hypothetical protein
VPKFPEALQTSTISISFRTNFDAFSSMDEHNILRDKIKLGRVVLDDPEADDFLYVLPESTFEFLKRQQERNPDWRNQGRNDRLSVYRRLKENKELPGNLFDEFESELMRLDLTTLDMVQVNFDQIPFGYDHTNSGIYRERHGDKYYIGSKHWLFAGDRHVTVLTTETLVMDAVVGCTNRYRHRGGQSTVPFRLALDRVVTPQSQPCQVAQPRAIPGCPGRPAMEQLRP